MMEGACEAHGALWQLLMHTTSSSSQQAKAPAKPAGGADEAAQQQLLALLRLQGSSSVQQLQRQVVTLQLMDDAQRAAGNRQRLWSDGVSNAAALTEAFASFMMYAILCVAKAAPCPDTMASSTCYRQRLQ